MTLNNNYRIVPALIALLALLAGIPGCSEGNTNGDGSQLKGSITEAGSTTVQPLAEKFASGFMSANPKVTVTIQGGGSGVGVKSANDGTIDIGAASRELTPEDPALNKILIARDGIAMIVNNGNKIAGLTKAQVIDIYNGKIKDWSQVGGAAGAIHVVAREEGSGTRGAFQELVMGKDLIVNTAILQSSNGALRTTVANDARAIAFLSFGYIDKEIKALAIDGVAATEENTQNGKYSVVRPLYFLTRNAPTGIVKSFLDYCTGPEGQKIVVAEGYLPIR
jgi:phosphate transport system substrate-binding protein